MRIVFMGTPEFSATILEELAFHHEVVCAYTRPDAVRGRGKKLVGSPVRNMAEQLGIAVRTPLSLRDAEVQSELLALKPDVICVAAYGLILPPEVLAAAPFGCLNVHASLLPRWRGAAPVERAILSGDEETGVCIMRMEQGLDTGPYCVYRTAFIARKTAEDLTDELANLGAHALLTALNHLENNACVWIEQDDDAAVYAHKIEKGELDLDPSGSTVLEARKVQASSAAHPSRCVVAGRGVSVEVAHPVFDEELLASFGNAQGAVRFVSKRLYLGCADGALEVLRLKPDGKQSMDASAFASGVQHIKSGTVTWESIHA